MPQNVLVFPVLPGKTETDARSISDEFLRRPDEYRESRKLAGITLERAYLQTTPMGMFVVVYGESENGFDAATGQMAQSDLPIDLFFRESVRELHGFDFTAPPPGPGPETIGVWNDPDVTSRGAGFAFCAPLLPGRAAAGRAFAADAYSRPELGTARRSHGITKEVVSLLSSPHGDIVAVYAEGEDAVEGNARFAASQEPFDVWFKGELRTLFPPEVDFGQPVPGVVEIFDSATIG
jgi:hypothetical protein